ERHPEARRLIACFVPPGRAVVIGEGEGSDAVGVRLPHHLGRTLGAVGVVRVHVQVAGPREEGGGGRGHPSSVPPGASQRIRLGSKRCYVWSESSSRCSSRSRARFSSGRSSSSSRRRSPSPR